MVEKRELEEKLVAYRVLQIRLQSLSTQQGLLVSKLVELERTIQSIEEVLKARENLFQIGSGAWVPGSMKGKEFVVEIGAGIALKKDAKEAKAILKQRRAEAEAALRRIREAIIRVSLELERLGPEIRKLAESLKGVGG
jgi:prefoldin alpha subunit